MIRGAGKFKDIHRRRNIPPIERNPSRRPSKIFPEPNGGRILAMEKINAINGSVNTFIPSFMVS